MPQCRVFGCSTQTGDPSISSFRFPKKDPERARKWLVACKIQFRGSLMKYNFTNHYICARHFTPDDFQEDHFSKLMIKENKLSKPRPPRLKENAVPTVNLPGRREEASQPRAHTIRRVNRQAKRRIVDSLLLDQPSSDATATSEINDAGMCVQDCGPGPSKQRCQSINKISTASVPLTACEQITSMASVSGCTSASTSITSSVSHPVSNPVPNPVSNPVSKSVSNSVLTDLSSHTCKENIPSGEVTCDLDLTRSWPAILPEFHDYILWKNGLSTAPPLVSKHTQTDWEDPILMTGSTPSRLQPTIPTKLPGPQPVKYNVQPQTSTSEVKITTQLHHLGNMEQNVLDNLHPKTPTSKCQDANLAFTTPKSLLTASVTKDHTYFMDVTTPQKPATPTHTPLPIKPRRVQYKDDFEEKEEDLQEANSDMDQGKEKKKDPDYKPPCSSSSDSTSDEDEDTADFASNKSSEGFVADRKYIVFESCLRELIAQIRCKICGSVFLTEDGEQLGLTKGSMLTIKLQCLQGHPFMWNSQPLLGHGKESVPAGNLLLSSAVLFSGTSFSKVAHMANFMNLEFISESCMSSHERDFIFPVVHETWYHEQHTLWRSLENTPLRISGDGRCDSPGFSAKYCTYVMMDMDSGKVLDIDTLSVNETSSSNAMEKLGCKRSLDRLKENGLRVDILCTDRHIGITAMMRDSYSDINHQVDLWHLAKSASKQLSAKAKKTDCQDLGPWLPSIRNHLWWSAASCKGDTTELIEKWRSVVYHVTDRHEWGGSQKYHECAHGPLAPEDRGSKKWLMEGSASHEALADVVNNKNILKGINQVNLFCHTGKTEVFNSSMLKFCPKRIHFPYEGMVVRTKLAAIENNHNTDRVQACVKRKTKNSGPVGSLRYRVVCPKAKKQWVAKPIFEKKNFGYVYNMMADVMRRKIVNIKGTSTQFFDPPARALEKNIAPVENPGKEVVVAAHLSRFSK